MVSLQEGQLHNLCTFHMKEFQSHKYISTSAKGFTITPIDNIQTTIAAPVDEYTDFSHLNCTKMIQAQRERVKIQHIKS